MADFPVVSFAQYQWEVNDQNYLTKWNNFQTAVTTLQTAINAFGEEVTLEKEEAADSAQESQESAALALQYRNEAQAIAVGDVAITDLQPGTLTAPKDYASVDAEGALVKRNLSADVSEQLQSGDESIRAKTIDYVSQTITTSAVLDIAERRVYEVDNTNGVLTLEFINIESLGLGKAIVIDVLGNAGIEFVFPSGITFAWSGGESVTPGDVWTEYLFMWTGSRLRGGKGLSE